ncbi:hypothetical protein BDZ45DRAFT_774294 [Acephala macrosclerotiorum]|nr:hypothetical protein BDZ45DRAFT_774294 [Acephala macrosclerotiorum]
MPSMAALIEAVFTHFPKLRGTLPEPGNWDGYLLQGTPLELAISLLQDHGEFLRLHPRVGESHVLNGIPANQPWLVQEVADELAKSIDPPTPEYREVTIASLCLGMPVKFTSAFVDTAEGFIVIFQAPSGFRGRSTFKVRYCEKYRGCIINQVMELEGFKGSLKLAMMKQKDYHTSHVVKIADELQRRGDARGTNFATVSGHPTSARVDSSFIPYDKKGGKWSRKHSSGALSTEVVPSTLSTIAGQSNAKTGTAIENVCSKVKPSPTERERPGLKTKGSSELTKANSVASESRDSLPSPLTDQESDHDVSTGRDPTKPSPAEVPLLDSPPDVDSTGDPRTSNDAETQHTE